MFVEWTRVNIFLPCNKPAEAEVVTRVVKRLRAKYGGATHSLPLPTSFRGYYKQSFPDGSRKWVRDEIVWLIIDTEEKVGDRELERYLAGVKEEIKGWYQEAGCEQEEIWIIAHQAWRLEG